MFKYFYSALNDLILNVNNNGQPNCNEIDMP